MNESKKTELMKLVEIIQKSTLDKLINKVKIDKEILCVKIATCEAKSAIVNADASKRAFNVGAFEYFDNNPADALVAIFPEEEGGIWMLLHCDDETFTFDLHRFEKVGNEYNASWLVKQTSRQKLEHTTYLSTFLD